MWIALFVPIMVGGMALTLAGVEARLDRVTPRRAANAVRLSPALGDAIISAPRIPRPILAPLGNPSPVLAVEL